MHPSWENSTSISIGSTSIMSNNFNQQPPSWFNPKTVQIKSEPTDFSNYIRSASPQQEMSPVLPQSALDLLEQMPSFRQMGVFNPLTPPGYSGLLFPSFLNNQQLNKQTTPTKAQDLSKSKSNNSSLETESSSMTPPMDVTPPKSPSLMDQTPEKDEQNFHGLETRSESVDSYDEESDDYDDDGLNVGDKSKKRKANNNKPRQYKCKQCKQIFFSKGEFWAHTRTHIKPEKIMQCPKCAFVTEYKHHLEYHLRNHSRSKPFRCPHCNYSCVNKSMLNSHLKSHSTVLQYRCVDCNYATKYCHSLKLHLRKYAHKPDIVLNLDGTPNPLPIIDVYGTRRGPKSKSTTSKLLAEIEKNQAQQNAQKSQLSPPLTPSTSSMSTTTTTSITKTPPSSLLGPNAAMMVNMLQNKMPLFPYFNLNFQMFAAQQHQQQQQQQQNEAMQDDDSEKAEEADTNFIENSPIKKPNLQKTKSRTKRKGKAVKFEEKINSSVDHYEDDEDYIINERASTSNIDNSISKVTSSDNSGGLLETAEKSSDYECKFCGIIFKDNVLFSLHIGYHSVGDDPFKCNMCGTKTEDKVQFFLHIAKFPHS